MALPGSWTERFSEPSFPVCALGKRTDILSFVVGLKFLSPPLLKFLKGNSDTIEPATGVREGLRKPRGDPELWVGQLM